MPALRSHILGQILIQILVQAPGFAAAEPQLPRAADSIGVPAPAVTVAPAQDLPAVLGKPPTAEMLPGLRKRALAGEVCAQAALGYLRALGIGMAVEPRDGRAEVERAAEQGCARAHYLLARLDEKVPMALRAQREGLSISDAARRLRAALERGAALGDGHARNHLATLLEIDHDVKAATELYRQAQADGNRAATQNLLRLRRLEAQHDVDEPIAALERRARSGDAEAQYRLARRLHRGQGVLVDYAAAWHWYQAAARQKFKPAEDMMALVLAQPRAPGEPVTATWWTRLAPFDVQSDPLMRQRGLRQPVVDEDPFYDMGTARAPGDGGGRESQPRPWRTKALRGVKARVDRQSILGRMNSQFFL